MEAPSKRMVGQILIKFFPELMFNGLKSIPLISTVELDPGGVPGGLSAGTPSTKITLWAVPELPR
jgi:hypothetical protein